jgi:hypothetical protein
MAWSVVGSVLVVVHDERAPDDDEWALWVREYEDRSTQVRAMLIYSTGGGPSSPQRKKLLDIITRLPRVPSAFMMTSSAAVRGIVTAMSWFLPPAQRAKTFRLDEFDRVFGLMALDAPARRQVQAEIERLGGSLGSGTGARPGARA